MKSTASPLVTPVAFSRLRYVKVEAFNLEDNHSENLILRIPATSTLDREFAPWHWDNYRIKSTAAATRDEFLADLPKPDAVVDAQPFGEF